MGQTLKYTVWFAKSLSCLARMTHWENSIQSVDHKQAAVQHCILAHFPKNWNPIRKIKRKTCCGAFFCARMNAVVHSPIRKSSALLNEEKTQQIILSTLCVKVAFGQYREASTIAHARRTCLEIWSGWLSPNTKWTLAWGQNVLRQTVYAISGTGVPWLPAGYLHSFPTWRSPVVFLHVGGGWWLAASKAKTLKNQITSLNPNLLTVNCLGRHSDANQSRMQNISSLSGFPMCTTLCHWVLKISIRCKSTTLQNHY